MKDVRCTALHMLRALCGKDTEAFGQAVQALDTIAPDEVSVDGATVEVVGNTPDYMKRVAFSFSYGNGLSVQRAEMPAQWRSCL